MVRLGGLRAGYSDSKRQAFSNGGVQRSMGEESMRTTNTVIIYLYSTLKYMDIQVLNIKHAPEHICRVAHICFHHWKVECTTSGILSVSDYITHMKSCLVLVAIRQKKLLGTISLESKDIDYRNLSPWLSSLFVVPRARGKGIATILISELLAKCTTVYLWTHPNLSFMYLNHGFAVMETTKYCGKQIYIMARK